MPGVGTGAGFSSVAVSFEPQLAQKRASVGLSCPQLLHLIDAINAYVYGLKLKRPVDILGGDRGIRTPDLRDANAALSQLSYIPIIRLL
jgi:hypothetical protein